MRHNEIILLLRVNGHQLAIELQTERVCLGERDRVFHEQVAAAAVAKPVVVFNVGSGTCAVLGMRGLCHWDLFCNGFFIK